MSEEDQRRARKRLQALTELLVTEQDYVRDLELITQIFIVPLQTKILSKSDCSAIFSNIDVILNINRFFVTQMNQRMEESGSGESIVLGDILMKLADFLKVYTVYVGNQEKSINTYQHCKQTNDHFNNFLKEATKKPECRGLDFIAFLIKPVQRICKYPLLIREILNNTAPTDPDYPALKQLMAKFEEVTTYVNEHKRKAENQQEILQLANKLTASTKFPSIISPSRRLLLTGTCYRLSEGTRKGRESCLFLFNDLLLETSPLKKGFYTQQLHLPLTDVSVRDLPESTPLSSSTLSPTSSPASLNKEFKYLFEVKVTLEEGEEVNLIYAAPSFGEKENWIEKLSTNIKESLSLKKTNSGSSNPSDNNHLQVRGLKVPQNQTTTLSPRHLASALQRLRVKSSSNKGKTNLSRSAPTSPSRSQPSLKDVPSDDEDADVEDDEILGPHEALQEKDEASKENDKEKEEARPLTRSRSSGLPKLNIIRTPK